MIGMCEISSNGDDRSGGCFFIRECKAVWCGAVGVLDLVAIE